MLGLCLVLSVCLSAREKWVVDGFETQHLSQDTTIQAFSHDKAGGVWLVVNAGVLRYDGRKTRRFPPFLLGLEKMEPLRLITDIRGKTWLWTVSGQVRVFQNGRWSQWHLPGEGTSRRYSGISLTETGDIFLVTEKEAILVTAEGAAIEPLPPEVRPDRLRTVFRTKGKTTWFCEENRILVMTSGNQCEVRHETREGLTAFCIGQNDDLFVADGGKLVRMSLGRISADELWPGSIREPVTVMVMNGDRLWLGTRGDGLWFLDVRTGVMTRCDLQIDPLYISDLAVADENRVWLATVGSGLLLIHPEREAVAALPEILKNALFCRDPSGRYLAASPGAVWQLPPGPGRLFRMVGRGLNSPRFWLSRSAAVSWLVGDDGVIRSDSEKDPSNRVDLTAGMCPQGPVLAGTLDPNGDIWLSCRDSLVRILGRDLSLMASWPLATATSSALVILPGVHVWMIRDGQLYRMNDENHEPTKIANEIYQTGWSRLAATQSDVSLLALHEHAGLGVLTKEQWLPLNLDLDPGFSVNGLKSNDRGDLWLSDFRGFRAYLAEGLKPDHVSGMASPGRVRYVGKKFSQWGLGGESGPVLWWLADNALYEADQSRVEGHAPIQAALDRLYVDGREMSSFDREQLTLTPDETLQLQLWIPQAGIPYKVPVRLQVTGAGGGWMPLLSAGDRLLIGGLGPGRYGLEICINAGDGRWQEAQVLLSWTVKDGGWPLYLLLAIGLLLAAGLVWLGLFFKNNRQKKLLAIDVEASALAVAQKYSTSGLSPERAEEIKSLLLSRMAMEKPYLQASLTLRRLADQMGVHYNHLSQVINDRIGQSAKEFINHHRVMAAAERLADPREKKSIIDIAFECGFYSKSVFNAAFKKEFGMTPSEYRESKKGN